jgi:predicted deacylase
MTTRTAPAPTQPSVPLTVDLDAQGRQIGVASISWSDHEHAYSSIPVPIAVLANGSGPTVVLTAGTHGDEWEGQVLLRRFIRETPVGAISGRVIVLPATNLPAVRAARRTSPIDNGNLNRAFPGNPLGTPTEAIADFVETELMSRADYAVDLHSGGFATEYLPCAFLRIDEDDGRTREKIAAAEALGLPDVFVVPAAGEHRTMSAAADRSGAVMVATELGGAGRISREILAAASIGLSRLLDHWGVLAAPSNLDPPGPTRFLRLAEPAVIPVDGLLEPCVTIGDYIERGQVVGLVHRLDDLDAAPVEVIATRGGVVAIVAVNPLVRAGSYACTIAVPTPPVNGRIPELT